MPSPARFFNRFCAGGTNKHLDLSLSWQASEDPFKNYIHVIRVHRSMVSQSVLLLVGKAQLAGCLKISVSGLLEWDAGVGLKSSPSPFSFQKSATMLDHLHKAGCMYRVINNYFLIHPAPTPTIHLKAPRSPTAQGTHGFFPKSHSNKSPIYIPEPQHPSDQKSRFYLPEYSKWQSPKGLNLERKEATIPLAKTPPHSFYTILGQD